MNDKVNKIKAELQHFKKSKTVYKIPFLGALVTERIRYLSTSEEYFELFMDMCVIGRKLISKSSPVLINFKRLSKEKQIYTGCEVEIIYTDENDNILEKQEYRETDFPLDELRLFFVNDTLMLPSEY